MTPRTERALIRFLLLWFRCAFPGPMLQEYIDLSNEVK